MEQEPTSRDVFARVLPFADGGDGGLYNAIVSHGAATGEDIVLREYAGDLSGMPEGNADKSLLHGAGCTGDGFGEGNSVSSASFDGGKVPCRDGVFF